MRAGGAGEAQLTNKMKVSHDIQEAYEHARAARLNAHAPYSGFKVGAALVRGDEVVLGCNVENASYGGTVCAERIAIFKAVSEDAISGVTDVVVVTDAAEPAYPCAFCLQVMAEFFEPSVKIWLADLKAVRSVHTFGALLPKPFGPKQLAAGTRARSGSGSRGGAGAAGGGRAGSSRRGRAGAQK